MRTERDMFLGRGSKSTSFICVGRKLFVLSARVKTDLVFVMVGIDLISMWDRTRLDFSVRMKLILSLCGRSRLT